MTLCLPSSVIDNIFAVSKTGRAPPSHVLVAISSSSSSDIINPNNAYSCQLVARDFRAESLRRCFIDLSVRIPSDSSQLLSSSVKTVSSFLSPSLTQTFVDLPVSVEASFTASSSKTNKIFLEAPKIFVPTSSDDRNQEENVVVGSSSSSQTRLILSFAVPLPLVTSSNPPFLSSVSVSCLVKDRVDQGKLLLNEGGLLNCFLVCSGGQNTVIADNKNTTSASSSLYQVMALQGEFSSSCGIVTSETRVIVNQKPNFLKCNNRSDRTQESEAPGKSNSNYFIDYNDQLKEAQKLLSFSHQKQSKTPCAILIQGPSGNGKTKFIDELLQTTFEPEGEATTSIEHISSSDLATNIFHLLKLIREHSSSGKQLFLVFDGPIAESFFAPSVGGSENLDLLDDEDDTLIKFPSPATQIFSILGSSENLMNKRVTFIFSMNEKTASSLVSNRLKRTLFAGSTISLDLPNEKQREILFSHFVNKQKQNNNNLLINEDQISALAQNSIGFSVWDIEICSKKICSNCCSDAETHFMVQIVKSHKPLSAKTSHHGQQNNHQQLSLSNTKKSSWDDIAGLSKIKEAIHRSIIWPINNPRKARTFGINKLSGVMLHGPPGNAKTTIAKTICSEGKFGAFFHLDCATVLSAYVGEAERTIRDVFHQARVQAPSVIFFDEIESFGVKRGKGGGSSSSSDVSVRLLATLLTEMDGMQQQQQSSSSSFSDLDDAANFGVCVIGATNLLHMVDDALLRPGRFDLLLEVPSPMGDDRELLFDLCLKKSRNSIQESNSENLLSITADTKFLSAISRGCSGAEITGAWRDGVVKTLTKMNKDLLLGVTVDVETEPLTEFKTIDVTEAVADAIRNVERKK